MFKKLNNLTDKEISDYILRSDIIVPKSKKCKKEIIKYIILKFYFDIIKKNNENNKNNIRYQKYIEKGNNIYIKRIEKELIGLNNIKYKLGIPTYFPHENKIKFSESNLIIKIPKNYPFNCPEIFGDLIYNDKKWSPCKQLYQLLEQYLSTISKTDFKLKNKITKIDDIKSRPETEIIESKIECIKKSNSNILEIEYIEYNNEYYNESYLNYKKLKFIKNNLLNNESFVFHGTQSEDIISIYENDFSLTKRPIHGSAFGKGIYFTNDIMFACNYSNTDPKIKYIILVYLYVGNTVLGRNSVEMLPKIPNTEYYYDTAVDKLDRPKQFIKKKNHQYNILGYLKLTLEKPIERNKFKPPLKYIKSNNLNSNIINQNLNRNVIINTPRRNTMPKKLKYLIFINKSPEEIFIYRDQNNIIDPNDELKLRKINNISKLKFIHEVKKRETFDIKDYTGTNFVCGYHDNHGYFNILNYFLVSHNEVDNTFVIKM